MFKGVKYLDISILHQGNNPEKLKEWRHNAYLNHKAKLNIQQDNKKI